MGMTEFLHRLRADFLNQLEDREIVPEVDVSDGAAVKRWVSTRFGRWFLDRRDELLAREWARRGWAEVVYRRDETGYFREVFLVKPACADSVNSWLQDEVS